MRENMSRIGLTADLRYWLTREILLILQKNN